MPSTSRTDAPVGDSDRIGFGNNLSETTNLILDASLRPSTKIKYKAQWLKFQTFCTNNLNIYTYQALVNNILDYFSHLYQDGKSFLVINSAKLAISHNPHFPPYKHLSEHPLVNKYFKDLFSLYPPKQKSTFVWDIKLSLIHI